MGLHVHIGSQIFALESFERALSVIGPFFAGLGLPELCIGGGLGVPYVTGESAPMIPEWAKTLRVAAANAGIAPDVVLTAEPGRSIVATAALTCYTVGTVKDIPGVRTYVSVDGGYERQPEAGALRLRLRGLPPKGCQGTEAPCGHRRRQAL